MFVGEENSPFGILPPEVIAKILKTNPYKGAKKTARRVCRRWRWIVDDPWWELVSFKAKIDSNKFAAMRFLKSRLQFESLFIQGVGKTDWPAMSQLEPLPQIQKISLGSEVSEETVLTFLSCGEKTLESLSFYSESLANVSPIALESFLSQRNWCNLAELHICVTVPPNCLVNEEGTLLPESVQQSAYEFKRQKVYEGDCDAIACLLRSASIPKLRKFNFNLGTTLGSIQVGSRMINLIYEFTGFLERHGSTLKDLLLSILLCQSAQPTFCLSGPIYSPERQESIGKSLEIESFHIRHSHSATLVNLVPPCLWELSKLTKLCWEMYVQEALKNSELSSPLLKNPVESLLLKSQETLVTAYIHFGVGNDNDFQPCWLEPCSALRVVGFSHIHNVVNTEVQLPQVTSVIMCLSGRGHRSGWVTKSFQNVEYITMDGLSTMDNNECEWLENLLPLVKLNLKRIKFSPEKTSPWFFQIVRGFCQKHAQLDYVSDGLIIVLPPLYK